MKKLLSMLALAAMVLAHTACTNEDNEYRTYSVSVQLETPDVAKSPLDSVWVVANGHTGTELKALTNEQGIAQFMLPEDIYNFSASHRMSVDGVTYTVNYQLQSTPVSKNDYVGGNATKTVVMKPTLSQGTKQIILKEVYVGGCQKDDGSGVYQFDKYVVIYNNSDQKADIKNFCISNAGPYNANAGANNYVENKLVYGEENYTPAHAYMFYMTKNLVMEPYSSATIVLCGAIDHTQTYSYSVDLSEADYVCYDAEDFWNTNYHPVPSEKISSDNYLLASKFCLAGQNATAWSMVGPGVFIFSTSDNDPLAYSQDPANRYYMPGKENNAVYAGAKIPNEWIFDAVDIWGADYVGKSLPRFSSALESGYIYMTNKQGYSIYRNVDQKATEALPENEGKLVYNYNLGTTDYQGAPSTDPSGIDAEASMANGAHIIFMDTNNSIYDFHQRTKASLKK